jgi:subtilase family serine protease
VQSVPTLAAGASTAPVATVAHGTPGGLYFLQACADGPGVILETAETNNCRRSAEKITVLARPDLVVTALTDPPAAAPPGGSFKVTNTVRNTGTVPAGTSTTKYYLLSAASTLAELTGTQSVPSLTAGAIFTEEETVSVPAGTVLGLYHLQACADAAAAVAEDNEADNCLVSAGTVNVTTLPDLVLSTVTLANAPVSVTPGGTITVNTVAKNAGVSDAGASTITFALVGPGGSTKTITETQPVPTLAAGASTPAQREQQLRHQRGRDPGGGLA